MTPETYSQMLDRLYQTYQVETRIAEPMYPKNVVDSLLIRLDLATKHDAQPYPTAEAYEKVCKALEKSKAMCEELETKQTEARALAIETAGFVVGYLSNTSARMYFDESKVKALTIQFIDSKLRDIDDIDVRCAVAIRRVCSVANGKLGQVAMSILNLVPSKPDFHDVTRDGTSDYCSAIELLAKNGLVIIEKRSDVSRIVWSFSPIGLLTKSILERDGSVDNFVKAHTDPIDEVDTAKWVRSVDVVKIDYPEHIVKMATILDTIKDTHGAPITNEMRHKAYLRATLERLYFGSIKYDNRIVTLSNGTIRPYTALVTGIGYGLLTRSHVGDDRYEFKITDAGRNVVKYIREVLDAKKT